MADIITHFGVRAGEVYLNTPGIKSAAEPVTMKLKEMYSHPAWHGLLNGMDCEEALRGSSPGTYILRREGHAADDTHYYISWVVDREKGFYGHRPFCLYTDPLTNKIGWLHRNGHVDHLENLSDLIPIMMHHNSFQGESFPLRKHSSDFLEKN